MARDDHGAAPLHVRVQDVPDVRGGDRVHGLERLVQDEQVRGVDHGGRQGHLLGHAGGVVGHERAAGVLQVHHPQQVRGPLGHGVRVEAMQQPGVGHELRAREAVEGAHAVGEHADPSLGLEGLLPHVDAVDPGAAVVRAQQPGGHRQGRGLARPVGPDHPEERAGRDVQVQRVQRQLVPEPLGQPARDEGEVRIGGVHRATTGGGRQVGGGRLGRMRSHAWDVTHRQADTASSSGMNRGSLRTALRPAGAARPARGGRPCPPRCRGPRGGRAPSHGRRRGGGR